MDRPTQTRQGSSDKPGSKSSRERTAAHTPSHGRLAWFAAFVVAAGLFAASSVAAYQIAGKQLTGMQGWPEPLGWITQVLAVESLPTSDGVEVRWVIWAVTTLGLLIAAIAGRRSAMEAGPADSVFRVLTGASVLLVALVGARSFFAAVPLVGWMWTWQLALALVWMLVIYVWTVRAGVEQLARAIGVSTAAVAGASLLFRVQAQQAYPNWPTGNVLLVTTLCLAGVFLLGTWTYERTINAWHRKKWLAWVTGLAPAGLLAVTAIVLEMAGRRAAVIGLAGGIAYLAVSWLWRRSAPVTEIVVRAGTSSPIGCHGPEDAAPLVADQGRAPSTTCEVELARSATAGSNNAPTPGDDKPQARNRASRNRRAHLALTAATLGAIVVAAVLTPRLLTAGRWQSVQYRVEMYKATARLLAERPAAWLVGIGPGHLGFDLTTRMRPLHAESPRIFHGLIADHTHSEPLEAIAELGLPLGLLYLALPLGALVGFGVAQRRAAGQRERLAIAGAGAALAAAMVAEATSIGMRQPGSVAMLVWALTGMGWACGAQAGAFRRLMRTVTEICAKVIAANQPEASARVDSVGRVAHIQAIGASIGVVIAIAIVISAWLSLLASAQLYRAKAAWNGQRYVEAARLLDNGLYVPTAAAWMDWKCLQGRTHYVLMQLVSSRQESQAHRARTAEVLGNLVSVCPAYLDGPVWLAKAVDEPARSREIRDGFLKYDPYNTEARLLEASQTNATPVEQLAALRLALRNSCANSRIARMAAQAASDAAGQELISQWVNEARQAMQQPNPAQWPDPLVLEGLRIAILSAGQQGKTVEALELSNQAADLLKRLSSDPWRSRLESVEMEVYLDQAWFGWLAQPTAASSVRQTLARHLQDQPEGVEDSFSQSTAAQLAAMLWLSEGQADEANQVLFRSDPTIDPRALQQMQGAAYARLLALLGSKVDPAIATGWTTRGKQAIGEGLWPKAMEVANSRGQAPWWQGVLRSE